MSSLNSRRNAAFAAVLLAGTALGGLGASLRPAAAENSATPGAPITAQAVPATPGFDRAKAAQAACGLLDASRGLTLGGIRIKDLVDEGRP